VSVHREIIKRPPELLFCKDDYLFLFGVIILAFLIRLIYLFEIKDTILFAPLWADAMYHSDWGKEILKGDWLSLKEGLFYKAPLYPYLLAILYKVFNYNLFLIRIVQVVIAMAGYVVLYKLCMVYFNKTVARIALILAAFYGTFIFFEGELEIVTLVISLNLFLLFSLTLNLFHLRHLYSFLAGIMLGLSALARPTILFFIPFVLIWFFLAFREKEGIRKTFFCAASFFIGIILLITPITIRNYMVGDEFVLISANGGINFYIGNNPDYDRTTSIHPGHAWQRFYDTPDKELRRELNVKERDDYWYQKSMEYILAEPIGYLALILKKTSLFWHSYEIKRNTDIYFFKKFSTVLGLHLISFAVVAPLALLGISITLPRRRRYLLLYFYVLYVMLSTIAFFVTARYRLPVVPVLIAFAGCSLQWFYQKICLRDAKKACAFIVSFFVFFFLINFDFYNVKEKNFARSHFSIGFSYALNGQYDRAEVAFKKAIELYPSGSIERADSHKRLGYVYASKGDYKSAIDEARKALLILPDFTKARHMLAEYYLRVGRPDQAIDETLLALKYDPENSSTYVILGNIYTGRAMYKDAMKAYKKALDINPFNPDAFYNLGLIYSARGLLNEAQRNYEMAIQSDPGYFWAYNKLGLIYLQKNQYDKGFVMFEKALKIKPDDEEVVKNLNMARKKMMGR
jgi:tetratricopeptide (TPR) repeat protein